MEIRPHIQSKIYNNINLKPFILNNLADNELWKYFIEKGSVIFSGENDYSKMFKIDDI